MAELYSTYSRIGHVITSISIPKIIIDFFSQLGNHSLINNGLNNYHHHLMKDDESTDILTCPDNTSNFLISKLK